MKGNTIVRKMRNLANKTQLLIEAGWEMELEGAGKKELRRIKRMVAQNDKAYKNIWLHNVARTELKQEVDNLITGKPTIVDAMNEYAVYEWADGTWCYHSELHEMTHMSDDYMLVWYDKDKHS